MIKNIFSAVEIFTTNCFSGQGEIIFIQYIQPVKAITLMFLVRENNTRKELHRLELTSKCSRAKTTSTTYKSNLKDKIEIKSGKTTMQLLG